MARLGSRCNATASPPDLHGGDRPSWGSRPRGRETCHRHDPGPLPTTSHHLLAQSAPVCSGLSTGLLETPTAFEVCSWPPTMFRKPSARALSAVLLPGFPSSAPLTQAGTTRASGLARPLPRGTILGGSLALSEPPLPLPENGAPESACSSRVKLFSVQSLAQTKG